jgi:4-hydroxybenzoate polyprenyltransferase
VRTVPGSVTPLVEAAEERKAAPVRGGLLGAFVQALRPKQWTKNVFVFAGLVFSGQLRENDAIVRACLAFAVFSAAASAVYLINDTADRKADAHHPTKRFRPIASGRLPVPLALFAALVLGAGSLAAAWWLSPQTLIVLAIYLGQSFAYSAGLKRVFLLDAFVVAIGFVLRAALGAEAVRAQISPWLLVCSFLLSLFLVLGKRRGESELLGEDAGRHRKVLSGYSPKLVDDWLTALTGATIVAFALYTQSERTVANFHTTALVYTVPFVVYALFRYQAMIVAGGGADPTSAVLRDKGVLISVAAWALTSCAIIYL